MRQDKNKNSSELLPIIAGVVVLGLFVAGLAWAFLDRVSAYAGSSSDQSPASAPVGTAEPIRPALQADDVRPLQAEADEKADVEEPVEAVAEGPGIGELEEAEEKPFEIRVGQRGLYSEDQRWTVMNPDGIRAVDCALQFDESCLTADVEAEAVGLYEDGVLLLRIASASSAVSGFEEDGPVCPAGTLVTADVSGDDTGIAWMDAVAAFEEREGVKKRIRALLDSRRTGVILKISR